MGRGSSVLGGSGDLGGAAVSRRDYTSQVEQTLWRCLAEICPQVQFIDGEGEEVAIVARMTKAQKQQLRQMMREQVRESELTRVIR